MTTKLHRRKLLEAHYEPAQAESLKLKVETRMGLSLLKSGKAGGYYCVRPGGARVLAYVILMILQEALVSESQRHVWVDFKTYQKGATLSSHAAIEGSGKALPFVAIVRATDGDYSWRFSPQDGAHVYPEITGTCDGEPMINVAIPISYFKEFK